MMRQFWIYLTLLLVSVGVRAQGPHEILLLVNANSSDSVEIAETWAEMRAVPPENILKLDIPEKYSSGEVVISYKDFTELILAPANQAIKERGLQHVLAWVYSSGFPLKIQGQYTVSITGLTYLRGFWPSEDDVVNANYLSPLFAGRSSDRDNVHFPQSFSRSKRGLRDRMPLPAMMLGYTGKRGNKKDEIISCLRTGFSSDGTKPDGTVYFVTSDDIRSEAREWQFPLVKAELEMMDINCIVSELFPKDQKNVLGIMMGSPFVKEADTVSFVPGAMCEHLTSVAAVFENSDQTKSSEWIRAGVTATAGTVTEPFAKWPKFPEARFYVYYASGCTMMESFYQSVRCPLQLLIIGEPLATPWKADAQMIVSGLNATEGVESLSLKVDVKGEDLDHYRKIVYLLDGRVIGDGSDFSLKAEDYKKGSHRLRIVAYSTGMVQNQVFSEYKLDVKKNKFFLKQ